CCLHLSLLPLRSRGFLAVFCSCLLLGFVVGHQLGQRFHRAWNCARYVAVHLGQQILVLFQGALLISQFLLPGGLCSRGNSRHFLAVMMVVDSARHASDRQNASQRPTRGYPPTRLPDNLHRLPRVAVYSLAPAVNARAEILQRLFQGLVLNLLVLVIRQFCPKTHGFPLSCARTFTSARDRCAFTVPSLSPVASAISLNS